MSQPDQLSLWFFIPASPNGEGLIPSVLGPPLVGLHLS